MYSNSVRPATVRLVTKLIAPLLDSGLVTNTEYNAIYQNLAYLAKKGEQMPPVPPRLITGQEAAETLGISFSQFRTLEREGAFPFKRRIIGGRNVRYRNADIFAANTQNNRHKHFSCFGKSLVVFYLLGMEQVFA